ncbi:MAG: AarF/ABC1/UbiB kinase family protein [Alphaproteobacteria bacterium]|nr:AarF/ABC1/UbiB kinase family protein [Alphaproteobacteria bacterium]
MTDRRPRAQLERLGGLPPPTLQGMLRRGARWGAAGAVMMGEHLMDRVTGRATEEQLGRRVRAMFQRVGGTAIKVGQQLSARADMLPQAVCEALAELNDRVTPLDSALALQVIEAEIGRPLSEVFREIDPEPIGSASIACVYQAWLPDGRAVAIKVQRPGIAQAFADDLQAFNLMTRFMEWTTFVRADSFGPLREDLAIMFGEEMDFRLESRYQRLFSDAVREAGIHWTRAPEVYTELSSKRVLAMEYIRATSARHVIEAVESGDTAALEDLASREIDPDEVAFRSQLLAAWSRFEASFFHADPHPGNVMIADGGDLILIDFGACGMTSRRMRRNHTEVIRYSLQRDHHAMAAVMTNDTSPLPYLDVDDMLFDMRDRIAAVMVALDDDHAHWSERVMTTLWLQLLEQARELQLRLNLDTVRAIRAFLLYDTLSFRMSPSLNMEPNEQYLKDRAQRQREAVLEELYRMPLQQRLVYAGARRRDLLARVERLTGRVELALSTALRSLELAVSQAARVVQLALQQLYLASLGAALLFGVAMVDTEAHRSLIRNWSAEAVALLGFMVLLALFRGRFALHRVKDQG